MFMVLGNHEWYLSEEDREVIRETGVTLLDHEYAAVTIGDFPLLIGGLSTRVQKGWLDEFDRKDGCKILLCHHPEYFARYLKTYHFDLVVSAGCSNTASIPRFGNPCELVAIHLKPVR